MLQPSGSKEVLREEISRHVVNVTENIRTLKLASRDISIFISTNKHNKGPQYEKALKVTLPKETNLTKAFLEQAHKMLDEIFKEGYQYKKTGVTLSNLRSEEVIEEDLFSISDTKEPRLKSLTKSMDQINQKFGKNTISYGSTGGK